MKKLIICLLVCIVHSFSQAQDWQWEYGNYINHIPVKHMLSDPLMHIDALDNVYTATRFDSVLLFQDTAFYITTPTYQYQNLAISKTDRHGKLVKGLMLQAEYGGLVMEPMVATDSELNIYLSVVFKDTLIINNTIVVSSFAINPHAPKMLLAKFDPDFNLLWHGLIESPVQEMNNGLVISPTDELYLAVYHSTGYSAPPYQVSFLGQDTSRVFERQVTSLLKVDTEGQLLWRKEIDHYYTTQRYNQGKQRLIYDRDDKIKLFYQIREDLIIDNDTLIFPELDNEPYYGHVKLDFAPDGTFLGSELISHGLHNQHVVVDSLGGFYFYGTAANTVTFKHDTIVIPEGETYIVVGRLDNARNLKWYHFLQNTIDGFGFENNRLVFALTVKRSAQIIDTTVFWPSSATNTVIVELDSLGQRTNLIHTNTYTYFRAWLGLDNCGNALLGGMHRYYTIFGEDTLRSVVPYQNESVVAKLNLVELPEIDLGPDTTACETYTLIAPEGYTYYRWNNIETNVPFHEVTESGTYELMVSGDEGCWLYATAVVDIFPEFSISLGADTTITTADTLLLSIAGEYDHFRWFDGSEDNELQIIGKDYGVGTFDVWVEVTDGPCVVRDSLRLIIRIGSSLTDKYTEVFSVKPNPFRQQLFMDLLQEVERIEIYTMTGQKLYSIEERHARNSSLSLDLSHFPGGIYLLKVYSGGTTYNLKILKL